MTLYMRKKILNIVLLFGLAAAIFVGCKEDSPSEPTGNLPPETSMALFPDSTIAQQRSQLHVHWWGDDPDGFIVGFYFKWEGLDSVWQFTASYDSLFSLPIGTVDTNYTFKVMAVDNAGNDKYDYSISRNGIYLGDEPFIDSNGNGVYDEGEEYYDVGDVDPEPAEMNFPIKNSAPVVEWSDDTSLPEESFPVMTIAWSATDLDGDETITNIQIALNDTTEFVSLEGGVRLITIRAQNLDSDNPDMEILINGSDLRIWDELLPNMKLNDNNRIYLRAVDMSGAVSSFIPLPDTTREWFVKKPKGDILILDDYESGSEIQDFYDEQFSTIFGGSFNGKYDSFDLENDALPYSNVTLYQTVKLFKFCFWYSDATPDLTSANLVTQKYIENGGKIAFSMTFTDSSSSFDFSLPVLQNFLPVDDVTSPLSFMLPGADVIPSGGVDYPALETSSTIGFVRTFKENSISSEKIYDLESPQISGEETTIAFTDASKNLFFIGLPLHQCDRNEGTVQTLIEKVLTDLGIAK